ncbi:MAG: PAS domain S-box protein [Clostridia bacterium]|nr:PAS domain S-box protein [Clostridia bacterium]
MKYHNRENYEESLELLDSILDASSEYAIIATDLNDRILLWNKGAEILYGYSSDEMVGKQTPMNLHKKDTIDNDILFIAENTFHSNIFDYKTNAIQKDGSVVPVSITVTPRVNKHGETIGFLIIVRDITKIKLQDQFRGVLIEIAHLVNMSRDIKEMCSSMISIISNFLNIPSVFICMFDKNKGQFHVSSHTGFCREHCSHTCKYIDRGGEVPKGVEGCFSTYSQLTINSGRLADHAILNYIDLKNLTLADTCIVHIPILSDISLIGILHIVLDTMRKEFLLTETQILSLIANEISAGIQRKQLEEEIKQYANNLERMVKERTDQLREKDAQLIQSGKLATLGEMATGIAHEINQPLGGINLMTQGLLMAKARGKLDDEILNDKLNSILEQIERINKIIAHLRTFARQSEETKQELNVNAPIIDVFKLIGEQLKNRDIFIELNLSSDLPSILADHNRLEQVYLNIIGNARDALLEFEDFINKLKKSEEKPEWVDQWKKKISIVSYQKDNTVIVEISDTAGGIPKPILHKVFEPFFTTKEVGKGTGLGLSISYGIVKDFGGTIEVESEEMKGSKFILKFPIFKGQ